MCKYYLLGDLHGNIPQNLLNKITELKTPVFQVGDFGYGFTNLSRAFPSNLFTISGNHDNPEIAATHANFLGRFGYKEFDRDLRIFYISGAKSVDWKMRNEYINWWKDEELSAQEMYKCYDLWYRIKPQIVISHDAPTFVSETLVHTKITDNRTTQFLQELHSIHQPKYWYFGHHHKSWRFYFQHTLFVCVGIEEIVKGEHK